MVNKILNNLSFYTSIFPLRPLQHVHWKFFQMEVLQLLDTISTVFLAFDYLELKQPFTVYLLY